MKARTLLLASLLCLSCSLYAEEAAVQILSTLPEATGVEAPAAPTYTVDREIAIQSRPGKHAHITKKLVPGEVLTEMNKSASGHYIRVKTNTGLEGWVLLSDLTTPAAPVAGTVPVSPAVMPPAQSVDELKAQIAQLQTDLNTLRQTSGNVIAIQRERDQLQETVIKLKRENETLTRDKNALDGEQSQSWFLIGAGVGLGGIILGVLLPQLNVRRRNNWSSF